MKKVLILGIVALMLQSCASIMTGKMQSVTFNSEPQGAKVIVDGRNVGTTPITTEVFRKSEIITFSLDGYQEYQLKVKRASNGWAWGNFVMLPLAGVAPLIGVLVDNGNGSGYAIKKVITPEGQKVKLSNSTINAQLKK